MLQTSTVLSQLPSSKEAVILLGPFLYLSGSKWIPLANAPRFHGWHPSKSQCPKFQIVVVVHLLLPTGGRTLGGPSLIQQIWTSSEMSDTTEQYAQLLNTLITVGIIFKGQTGGPRKKGSSGCGAWGRLTSEYPGQGMCKACPGAIRGLYLPGSLACPSVVPWLERLA